MRSSLTQLWNDSLKRASVLEALAQILLLHQLVEDRELPDVGGRGVEAQVFGSGLVGVEQFADLALAQAEVVAQPLVGLAVDIEEVGDVFGLFVGVPAEFAADVHVGQEDGEVFLGEVDVEDHGGQRLEAGVVGVLIEEAAAGDGAAVAFADEELGALALDDDGLEYAAILEDGLAERLDGVLFPDQIAEILFADDAGALADEELDAGILGVEQAIVHGHRAPGVGDIAALDDDGVRHTQPVPVCKRIYALSRAFT